MVSYKIKVRDIRELITLSTLDSSIEDEDVSISLRLEDENILLDLVRVDLDLIKG